MSIEQALIDHLTGGFTALGYLDTINENPPPADRPDAGYVTMDFPGGKEEVASIGNAGGNRFRTDAVAQVHVFVKAGSGTASARSYAKAIRALFRGAKITTADSPAQTIHVYGVDPAAFGPGGSDGRYFRATIAFDYWYDTFG